MNNKKAEKEIEKVVKKYKDILLLQRHTFNYKYPTASLKAIAECVVNYPYLNVTINYGDMIKEKLKNKEDIAPYIVHEMCHVITDPFYCKAVSLYKSKDELEDERELLTDYICNIVIKNKL